MYTKDKHSQVIYFDNKTKRFVHNIEKVEESTEVHLYCTGGIEFIINKDRVNYTICIPNKLQHYNLEKLFDEGKIEKIIDNIDEINPIDKGELGED